MRDHTRRTAAPRINQRYRARKDLLTAAARLIKDGRTPSMDDVAEAAKVSRATAYRYFPTIEQLLIEAPLDGAVPDPAQLFAGDPSTDPVDRVDRAEAALHEMCYRNAAQLRLMLAASLSRPRSVAEGASGSPGAAMESSNDLPIRQNRRMPLIEAALAPVRDRLESDGYQRLCVALALIFGSESMIVCTDVLGIDQNEARKVKSWALRALVEAALADSSPSVGA